MLSVGSRCAMRVWCWALLGGFIFYFYPLSLAAQENAGEKILLSHARILQWSGDVSFLKTGSDAWKNVDSQVTLSEGDKIKTSAGSSATLELSAQRKTGTVQVRENTEFTIAAFRHETDTKKEITLLDVEVGGILIQAEKLSGDSKFEVKTPASMVGIRGTTFNVQVSKE